MFKLYHELVNEGQSKFLQKIRKKMQSQHLGVDKNQFETITTQDNLLSREKDVFSPDQLFETEGILEQRDSVEYLEVVDDVSDI